VVVDRRVRLVNGNVFEKNRTDAFSSRSLEAWLEERGVGEVILAGVDAASCVSMTARGGPWPRAACGGAGLGPARPRGGPGGLALSA